jgi:hypothetical protein
MDESLARFHLPGRRRISIKHSDLEFMANLAFDMPALNVAHDCHFGHMLTIALRVPLVTPGDPMSRTRKGGLIPMVETQPCSRYSCSPGWVHIWAFLPKDNTSSRSCLISNCFWCKEIVTTATKSHNYSITCQDDYAT